MKLTTFSLLFSTLVLSCQSANQNGGRLKSGPMDHKACVIDFKSTENDVFRLEYNPNFYGGSGFEVESLNAVVANIYEPNQKITITIDNVRGTLQGSPRSNDRSHEEFSRDLTSTGKILRAEFNHFPVPKTRVGAVFGHSRLKLKIDGTRTAVDPISGSEYFRFDLSECQKDPNL